MNVFRRFWAWLWGQETVRPAPPRLPAVQNYRSPAPLVAPDTIITRRRKDPAPPMPAPLRGSR